MVSARDNSHNAALPPTLVSFDRSLNTPIAIATIATAQAVAPVRHAPTTYVTSDRVRKNMEPHELVAPKNVVESAHRHLLRPPLFPRCPGPYNRDPILTAVGLRARARPNLTAANAGQSTLRLCEIADLPEGTYLTAALHLNARTLCEVDATCRTLRMLNQTRCGPWHTLGARTFPGIELEKDGIFDVAAPQSEMPSVIESQDAFRWGATGGVRSGYGGVIATPPRGNKHAQLDWKARYCHFQQKLPTFQLPFIGQEIHHVQKQDQVAYCCCMLRTDLLCKGSDIGVYIEFEVFTNVDNLSLALVDFETAGNSCVTFSPDTGAVFREKKVREAPRKVEGAYLHPLAPTLPSTRFEGSLGLYLYAGHLAFFRRSASDRANQDSRHWESTGFITDLSWAEGRCLAPCLAFRKNGNYHVKIITVNSAPPLPLGNVPQTYDESLWRGLDWEVEAYIDDP